MGYSRGHLTVVLILAVALAGCQPIVDTVAPSPPVDGFGANGAEVKENAKLPGGEATPICKLPPDYCELKKRQKKLGDDERKMLENYFRKAVADFQAKGSGMLEATLKAAWKAKKEGYDLAPLCKPNITFNEIPNHLMSQLYQAGQNQFDVRFEFPA